MSNPCLYVFVNTDLESMNFGKAMAQSSHAANAFVFEHVRTIDMSLDFHCPIEKAALDWYYNETKQGFGTQSNLKSNNFYEDMQDLKLWAEETGYAFGIVTDPTYPFEVTKEVFNCLDMSRIVSHHVKGDGKVICTRAEDTAFYIFGDRDDPYFKNHMRQWKLHP